MTRLREIRDCFEGVIPSVIATLDAAGAPNVSYLSQVHFVDDEHVALSNQFLSKTARNVAETGQASAMVIDGLTGAQHELDLSFVASLTSGDIFDRMSAHLRAPSTQHGMEKVMRLKAAELYRVTAIRTVPVFGPVPPGAPPPSPPGERLPAAARVAAAVAEAADPDAMVDRALDGLRDGFGYAHVMLFLPAP
ncbi:MAG: pyridoxamine 5'-phosphate oxidase family protein, partial [Proteobacteria bacterium]|nr:pyridoxamine 5'-phosphate oxidase family protein [Pseudomonadota bacterium]